MVQKKSAAKGPQTAKNKSTINIKKESKPKTAKSFWALDFDDFVCFFFMILSILFVWYSVTVHGSINNVLHHWDGPNYLYAGLTLYDIPQDNPWTVNFKYPPSYFACHLPGYPLLIRLCSIFCLGHYVMGYYLSIIVGSCLFTYSFRRLLLAYNCVQSPFLSTMISCWFPIRFVIYHSVGASEPLYISAICLSLIFYKFERFFPMLLSVWLGCITRIEGMSIGFTIGLCYLLRLKIFRAAAMFLTFVPTALLVLLHHYRFNDALAYIHFNSGQQHIIQWPPLNDAYQVYSGWFYNYGSLATFFIYLFGTFLLYEKSVPIAIFCTVHMCYVSLLFHLDVFRYQLPASVFVTIIAFDKIITKRTVLWPCFIALLFPLFSYVGGQINSNTAWPQFMDEIYESIEKVKNGGK